VPGRRNRTEKTSTPRKLLERQRQSILSERWFPRLTRHNAGTQYRHINRSCTEYEQLRGEVPERDQEREQGHVVDTTIEGQSLFMPWGAQMTDCLSCT